jgi:hypothetical protein
MVEDLRTVWGCRSVLVSVGWEGNTLDVCVFIRGSSDFGSPENARELRVFGRATRVATGYDVRV